MTEEKEFCKFYQKGRKCSLKQDDFRCIENLGGNCASYRYYAFELEQENKELQAYKDVNEDFKKAWDELNEKYKQLRSALETIQRMILSAWEQGKYLDGGLYNDLINEFAKINEVLQ